MFRLRRNHANHKNITNGSVIEESTITSTEVDIDVKIPNGIFSQLNSFF